MSGNAINLSLLARGIGEVRKNGSERVDVKLEEAVRINIIQTSTSLQLGYFTDLYTINVCV